MKSLSITTKLWLPIAGLALMVLLMTAVSASRTAKLQAEAQLTQAEQQRKFELALRWRGLTESNATRATAGLLSSDPAVASTLKPQIEATTATISEMQKELEGLANSAPEKAVMARIAETRKSYIAIRNEASKLKSEGQAEASVQLLQSKMQPAIATYLEAQADFVKLQQQRSGELREQAGAQRMRTVWMVAGAMSLITLALAVATAYQVRSIAMPLRELVREAERIGSGDLAAAPLSQRSDEIGEVQRALAAMREALARALSQVRHSADSIQTASAEIASGNADLSTRTEQTASNLQQTASSMSQLTGAVRQSADAAGTANQLATSAAEVAQRGGAVVGQVVSTMGEINDSSRKISDIIGTIDGIAFQTNILALNAAVEAARAGEQGRGFAVVAGEVRSLAQRSASAAREIKALIGNSVERVEAGTRLVQDAGSTMNEIVASVQRVADIIAEIGAGAGEQSQGISTINTAVNQLDQMTQQNAALVEESAAAAESLKDQAQRLSEVVATFRLG
ncbi:MAG: methyl-accepting chemotaxis protein [Roseateles asaccharophilus]|uniref:Methyl-accepting chemotaxis protein n=1 Tax=Roseateles asaccharophilus TaxID=582607 RepID=A0A4V6PU17_9BURK|nr:methyl-accepting chemotaxis protein [Roseateles asaccharophilus]MDN3546354.1 methyl-accepting chemotaxis protein [Roseateles asaccharophilus]TDP04933.1 methyl-accepting chemotaxis protein [Roseateles asaccharophilus]